MRNVSVSLNADNQIAVQVGSESRAGESYYLGLQPNSENHEFRPATGTMQLVTEWIRMLTALNDALRAVMNDGAPLVASWPELAVLLAWGGVSFVVAVKIFRWQ